MQNLLLKELEQIERMNNLSLNKLKQIVKTRRIKIRKDASKENLISLLKSNQSHAKLQKSEDNNAEIKETKKIFNGLRNNFSKEEIKKIRRKFRFREDTIEYLKELEQKDNLTEQEKQNKKRYTKKLKKAEDYFKKLKEYLSKLEKYQYNEDLDYKGIRQIEILFDKINDEDYYKPININGAFNHKNTWNMKAEGIKI